MDSKEYKILCDRKDAFRREWMEKTITYLKEKRREDLAIHIEEVLSDEPIEKPHDFRGDKGDDWFVINISKEVHEEITNCLFSLEASSVGSDGETTAKASDVATLVDLWNKKLLG